MKTNIIALYYPQFHAIPENDLWWGKGFTDWNNVRNGYSLYSGHRQPRIPLNDNYYDLSDYETIKWQVDLANKYNLGGFAIYHYWFEGKQLLETPKEILLNHPELDIPFCLTWANETWSRRWEGNDQKILIEQTHKPEKERWKEHFDYLLPYFSDHRAIRINGKILFQIYRPHLIEQLPEMISYWRKLAHDAGIGELYFMAIKSFDFPQIKILDCFDGVLLFQPAEATNSSANKGMVVHIGKFLRLFPEKWIEVFRSIRTKTQKTYKKYDYNTISNIVKNRNFSYRDKDIFNMAFLEWDNTARYKEKATIYDGCNPQEFQGSLRGLIDRAKIHSDGNKYVFVNAWNEWAEGTYLEPDSVYGYEYLEVIKMLVNNIEEN